MAQESDLNNRDQEHLRDQERQVDSGSQDEAAGVHPLTWEVLIARWVEFAQSAVALSSKGAAGRLKASVTDIIALQAVWFALDELAALPVQEQALGLDRAGVLIEQHCQALEQRWSDEVIPEDLQELMDDAKARWQQVRGG